MFGKIVDVQQKKKLKNIGNLIYQLLAKLWMKRFFQRVGVHLAIPDQTDYAIGINVLCHQRCQVVFYHVVTVIM
jgi:hypothetical protein